MTQVIRKTVNRIEYETIGLDKVLKQVKQVDKALNGLSLPTVGNVQDSKTSRSSRTKEEIEQDKQRRQERKLRKAEILAYKEDSMRTRRIRQAEHTEPLKMNKEFDKRGSSGRDVEALKLRKERFLGGRNLERLQEGDLKTSIRDTIKYAKSQRELSYAIIKANKDIATQVKLTRDLERSQKESNFMTRRFTGSIMQMAGAFGSAYSAFEIFASTIQTGMEFEKAEKSMLAVSENATVAGENLQFVREESMRLGVDMMDGTKTLSRYLATVNEDFSTDDARKLFTAMSEISVTMGLTADESKRANISIAQMLSKGQVMSEELNNLGSL